MFSSSKSHAKIENLQKREHRFILDDYSNSHERIFVKSGKFSMDVKRKHELCIEIYTLQTPNSLGDKFSHWDSQNETLITHYEKKSRNHVKCFLFWEIMSRWEYI